MWFWLSWRDHTTLMQFPLECATLLSALMFRHPWLRCRLPADKHECHRALWRSAKTTGQHLGEGKDDVISISYHLSPDFFHYQAGHWLWRWVKMPGLWTALHKLKGASSPMNPMADSCHGEVDRDCCLPLKEVLKGLMNVVLSLQELTSCLSGWERDVRLLRGQERKHRQPREREKICWHSQQGAFFI